MKSFLRLHTWPLVCLAIAANLGLQLYLATGELKEWAQIDWMDVAGEGGSAVLALVWLVMLLRSRPAGRVTRLLTLGLACIFFAWWMDTLDEFVQMPQQVAWDNWLETAPMPVGLLLLTLGIYHLNQEQRAISQQMSKREKLFREHRLFDKVTPLGAAEYLRQQIQHALAEARENEQPLSLVAVDLDDFDAINRRFGQNEGDAVLQAIAQLLMLNLRRQDLLCRLAGDRFVAVLPNTGEAQARMIADELQQAVASLAHRTGQHGERLVLRASTAAVMALDDDSEQLLRRLNLGLAKAKQQLPRCA
ncbi:GGDEF domain-containing protein [Stutzerimonas degradans]|uniref:diguanylate cyclase n=1 Tax=Stutzerimonas degradans TaxID=2968968 RepID=A0A8E2U0V1_9GAMM|nr:GGDEF domain-containing protein [Stutzerimonas degradans]MCQ4275553.1 GGDEF domain-containing protein [Stutzerimonas degradans]PNF75492.1 GGDEF domain-containing protein [Stutzerimonas degradans]QPT22896.1 GGDEF domain-containing protein [Stutzerimonas degradans]